MFRAQYARSKSPSTANRHAATNDDSTGLVGSRGRGSHPPSGPLEASDPHQNKGSHLSERLLFRGYGVDPDDVEAERIRRVP